MRSLLDPSRLLLLRAATRTDRQAVDAFVAWRQSLALDDIDAAAHRAIPMLVETARRYGIVDPDLERMRGIGRFIWTSNMLQLRLLFAALDALEGAGIAPLLLKGAAVFARAPALAAKRLAGDYDIEVPMEDLPAARAALEAAGFVASDYDWNDIEAGMPGAAVAGAPIAHPGFTGTVDLHWRPLPRLYDPALSHALFASAETMTLQGRAVRVPSLAHHLFTAIARCELWDHGETLHRLIECHFLIVDGGGSIDWDEVEALCGRYRLQPLARMALQTLIEHAGTPVPPGMVTRLGRPGMDRPYWRASAVAPRLRTPLQHWVIHRGDARAGRSDPGVTRPGLVEAAQRQFGVGLLARVWRRALARQQGPSNGVQYLEGFSYPEAAGRWTDGVYALMRLPLPPGDRPIVDVDFAAIVFRGQKPHRRIKICAGEGISTAVFAGRQQYERLRCKARRNERLGGDALILIELRDAVSPFDAGQSPDIRRLGLFMPRELDVRFTPTDP